ncbi:hypothetical protein MTP99_014797 [Tenebrio molitor]|jgi:hypothetical protein|nr:hypothetical protein MTP99_014797 [Tenebrio molitor]
MSKLHGALSFISIVIDDERLSSDAIANVGPLRTVSVDLLESVETLPSKHAGNSPNHDAAATDVRRFQTTR